MIRLPASDGVRPCPISAQSSHLDTSQLTANDRGISRRTADRRWAFARSRLADASAVR